jgi:6,7-dimethyl-8-ribityllumazine synthase
VFDVPGAFELPPAAGYAARSGRFAGVACLGAVIRGETDHYWFVCAEAARGVMQVQLETGVPCAFGVLTCETMEQALARAGGGKRDQGRHAAEAVLRMAALREQLLGAQGLPTG